MKTTICFIPPVILLASAFTASSSSNFGFSTDPMGDAWDRNEAGTAFAQWDQFSAFTLADTTPGAAFAFINPFLDQTATTTGVSGTDQGAGVYESFGAGFSGTAGDELVYSGGRSLNYFFTGETAFAIKGLTLQVKRVLNSGGTQNNFFALLNGMVPDAAFTVSGTGDTETSAGGVYSTTTYYWGESLASSTATSFSLQFATTASSSGSRSTPFQSMRVP